MHVHATDATSEDIAVGPPHRRPAETSQAAAVLAMQRTAGNQATAGLFAGPVVQRALGAYSPDHNTVENVTQNEAAKYERLNNKGRPNAGGQSDRWTETENGRRVKHYLIAWVDDDTVVLGLKAAQSPYGGAGGYGLGYPALAGGTSEMSGPEMDTFYNGGAQPADAMRDRTLGEEVGQELWDEKEGRRNPYRLDQAAPVTAAGAPGSDNRNVYKTWEGRVSRDPGDLRAKPPRPQVGGHGPTPAQGKQLAYYENTGTFEVKVSVLANRLGAQPSKQDVLREVATVAGNSVPADITGNEQARIYLDAGNYPLQAFADVMIAKIAEHRQATLAATQPGVARDGKRKAEPEDDSPNKRRETEAV